MLATPAFSQADIIVARLRRDKALREHTARDARTLLNAAATPPTPNTTAALRPPRPVTALSDGERDGERGIDQPCAPVHGKPIFQPLTITAHSSVRRTSAHDACPDPEVVRVTSRGLSNAKPTETTAFPHDPERVCIAPDPSAPPSTPNPDLQDPGPHNAAQPRAAQAEGQDRQPSTPVPAGAFHSVPTLSPLHPDFDLLLDFLSPSLSIGTLCSRHGLAPHELAAWLATPIVQASIDTMKLIIAARQPLIDLQIPEAVKATHLAILSQQPPEDPRLAARHAETARKSASALTRLLKPPPLPRPPSIPTTTTPGAQPPAAVSPQAPADPSARPPSADASLFRAEGVEPLNPTVPREEKVQPSRHSLPLASTDGPHRPPSNQPSPTSRSNTDPLHPNCLNNQLPPNPEQPVTIRSQLVCNAA